MSAEDVEASSEGPVAEESAHAGRSQAGAGTVAIGERQNRLKLLAFVLLPSIAMVLASLAGFLKWQEMSRRDAIAVAQETVAIARDTTIAILSYQPDTADTELHAVSDRLTGPFRDSYTKLIDEVVIPGAKAKKVSATAEVPAAGPVSVTSSHAVALVFVNQSVTTGKGAPVTTASSVKVTLDKVGGRWLVSGFDPV